MSRAFRITVLAILLVGGIALEVITPRQGSTPRAVSRIEEVLPTPRPIAVRPTLPPTTAPLPPSLRECPNPIALKVGNIDHEFNLDAASVRRAVQNAADEWNARTGSILFTMAQPQGIAVNFLFDGRQEELELLKTTEASLDRELAQLKMEQEKRLAESESIDQRTQDLYRVRDQYEQQVAAYNSDVARAQSAQSLDPQTAANLTQRRDALETLRGTLEASSAQISREVKEYNERARKTEDVNEINVYTYTDDKELHYTLLHELGHALGLRHSDQPGSVMSPVREIGATSFQLTPEDIAAARKRCGGSE